MEKEIYDEIWRTTNNQGVADQFTQCVQCAKGWRDKDLDIDADLSDGDVFSRIIQQDGGCKSLRESLTAGSALLNQAFDYIESFGPPG